MPMGWKWLSQHRRFITRKMIKRIFHIIILFSLFSCNENYNLLSSLEDSTFSQEEKNDIIKLVQFFESNINNEGESDLNFAYRNFIRQSVDSEIGHLEFLQLKMPYDNQVKVIENINHTTKNEIWSTAKATAYKSYKGSKLNPPIQYGTTSINIKGKYLKWLEILGETNPKIKHYVKSAKDRGDFPPFLNTLQGLIMDTHANWTEDLSKPEWRIIISIHFINSNEELNSYKSIN